MTIIVDLSTTKRISDLKAEQGAQALFLRITVDGGGCSGFQYKMELTGETGGEDTIFADSVVTDPISLPFLKDSVILFEESLIGSEFKIENPNAVSGCGCGVSFSVKSD